MVLVALRNFNNLLIVYYNSISIVQICLYCSIVIILYKVGCQILLFLIITYSYNCTAWKKRLKERIDKINLYQSFFHLMSI